ncbi:hypothetical protein MNBD_ALPHA12-164 [hydrothermal vent metagenome]|uniref:DUF2852 domain-containing protein n=1 Tax=hydrothermal vent metagenome TaxID=652676 RepID=A0A3B0TZ67_9ZZZZ
MNTALIKPEWSFITITLMVVGFILFWPLGLAVLAYILWGERFGGSAEKAERWINRQKGSWKHKRRHYRYRRQSSGNAAFDDYRDEQLKRLDEERRRLDEEINQFHDFVYNLRRARDRDEFDRFMHERGSAQGGHQNERSERDDENYRYRDEFSNRPRPE